MSAFDEEQAHYDRVYQAKERDVRRQLIPPIIFFLAILAVVLVSVVKHFASVRSGVTDPTAIALQVDTFTACLGNTVYENTDELDDSYGDYFYLGADYFEIGVGYTKEVAGQLGTVVFSGEDEVESYTWLCDEAGATADDVAELAEEIDSAYGDYTWENGACIWYADEDGRLGENTDAAWVACGINDDGILYVCGSAH